MYGTVRGVCATRLKVSPFDCIEVILSVVGPPGARVQGMLEIIRLVAEGGELKIVGNKKIGLWPGIRLNH